MGERSIEKAIGRSSRQRPYTWKVRVVGEPDPQIIGPIIMGLMRQAGYTEDQLAAAVAAECKEAS